MGDKIEKQDPPIGAHSQAFVLFPPSLVFAILETKPCPSLTLSTELHPQVSSQVFDISLA